MGTRLYGYHMSGSDYTSTLDVGTLRIVPTGGSITEAESPGGLACCLFVYSANKWVPCHYSWLA